MSDSNQREDELFRAASNFPETVQREIFLREACKEDRVLHARLQERLASHEATMGSIEQLPSSSKLPPTVDHEDCGQSGKIIAGKYKLLNSIGEGGMGTVWMAEQRAPVKRLVAIKLIKAGMDSKLVLARFEAERQALALMDHPNIARILDGGITESGYPYFVMELVKGVPITEFCDARRLTPKQRLELFIPVCQAIQHAHQKGIIHRDIKPSNVMVSLYDDKPVPKVIDFGVAKATGQALTEQTLNTGFSVVGTPQYMSPEQATFNQLDIDTRSDIYSLGVLLYELLAGSTPFEKQELQKAGYLEILRVIREDEPPRPSTKLSTAKGLPSISATRSTEPRRLTGMLRNELDWLVMKALEKDRTRRYETANGFAADVQRYLAGEQVLAHPPSIRYRIQKFVRRNRGRVLAAGLLLAALMAGITGTTVGLVRATKAESKATTALGQVTEEQSKTKAALGEVIEEKVKTEQALVRATEEEQKAKLERAEADRQRVIANQEKLLAEYNEKLARRQAMLSLNTIQLVVTDIDGILAKLPGATAIRIAMLEILSKKWDELNLEMVGGLEGEAIPTLMTVRFKIAQAWVSVEKVAQANTEFEKLEQQARRRFEIKGRTDDARDNLARILTVWSPVRKKLTGDPGASLQMLEEALALYREILRDPRPAAGSPPRFSCLQSLAMNSLFLANEYTSQGNLPKAEVQFREGKDMFDIMQKELELLPAFAALPEENKVKERTKIAALQNTARYMTAYVRLRRSAVDEAVGMFEESLKHCRQTVDAAPDELAPKSELAALLRLYGISMMWASRLEDAARLLGEAQQVAEFVYEADPAIARNKSSLGTSLYALASLRELEQRRPEAIALFERCRLYRTEMFAASQDVRNRAVLALAEAHVGDIDAAEKLVVELGMQTEKNGDLHIDRARALNQLALRCDGDRQIKLREESLAALERAIADGFLDPFRIRAEPDLISLRDTEVFQQILSKLDDIPPR